MVNKLRTPSACYLTLVVLAALLAWSAWPAFIALLAQDQRYSYTVVIPFISAGLIWLRRSSIFRTPRPAPRIGIPLLACGALLCGWAAFQQTGALWLPIGSVVLMWIAGFVLFFGRSSLGAALFPMLLLSLMVPLPPDYMKVVEVALQKASAETAYVLFRLTGMPVFRQGLTFSLPGVDVQVAEECSGIRSSLSLVIVVLVASQLFLKSRWRQLCLTLLAIPIVIFKNAVRITTLSWLGIYVSPEFFHGDLHRYGGLPFSLLAFGMLVPIWLILHRSENRPGRAVPVPPK